jgi:hypothetical protein
MDAKNTRAGSSLRPLRSRLLTFAVSVAVLAVGSVSVAGANSAPSGGSTAGFNWVSLPAPGSPGNASPLSAAQLPPGATDQATPLAPTSSCPDGQACMWRMNSYAGEERDAFGWMHGLGWIGWSDDYKANSAKNRFGNRAFWVGDAIQIIACLDPGENRPNLDPAADRFNVGGGGSHC